MRRIKVIHIINTLNVGGAERNLLNFVTSADACRFEHHVAYSGEGELAKDFKAGGVKLFQFAPQPYKLRSLATPLIVWKLAQYIKKENIDIAHTHTFNAHVWGSVAAKMAGCKILEHVHDSRYMDPSEFERRGEKSRQYRYLKFLKNISDRVVVLTRQNYDFIVQNKLHQPAKVKEIQNGIDVRMTGLSAKPGAAGLKNTFNIAPHAPVVLTPIRFSPEKNLDVLFQIVLGVVRARPQAVCLIAGTGPQKEYFESLVKAKKAESGIKVIGFYPDMTKLLALTDVFLLPSTIELHSIAILEALRQKVPVVVSRNVGCNDEFLVDWHNGVLLDPFSPKGWTEAVVRLLDDPALRRRIGENGFQTCRRMFDIRRTAKQFEELYVELTGV